MRVLKQVTDWHETAFSVNILAYQNRCKLLGNTFGDLYTTEILDVKKANVQSKGPAEVGATTTTTNTNSTAPVVSSTKR